MLQRPAHIVFIIQISTYSLSLEDWESVLTVVAGVVKRALTPVVTLVVAPGAALALQGAFAAAGSLAAQPSALRESSVLVGLVPAHPVARVIIAVLLARHLAIDALQILGASRALPPALR